jgi:hypothetical protein
MLRQEFAIDYKENKIADEETIQIFYHPLLVKVHSFPNIQQLNFESLKGQLLSASCMPLPGHPSYSVMINKLISLFFRYKVNGLVSMEFETKLFINR